MSIIKSMILEDHTTDGNRSGEGAAVELRNGSLLFVYGQFNGSFDASPARLVSRKTVDGGMSWSDSEVFLEPDPEWVNIMSVSLLRLQNGHLGCAFLVKPDKASCLPYWTVSQDDGATWREPQPIVTGGHYVVAGKQFRGYYVVNNDRLVQLAGGRLLLPYHHYVDPPGGNFRLPRCGCLVSDDHGDTWRHGREEIDVQPENYHIPELVVPDRLPALRIMTYHRVNSQEPGVIELTDGRIMMWARSNGGCAYAAFSKDKGETWSPFKVLCNIPMAQGPATIKRVPGTRRLVMIHNDRTGIPYGSPDFPWRSPLAVSVSDNEGADWQQHPPLIGDDAQYCYYSLLFFGERSLATTYESATIRREDGSQEKKGRAKLRMMVLDNSWWLQ